MCGNSEDTLPESFASDPEMGRLEVAMNSCLNSAGTFQTSTVEEDTIFAQSDAAFKLLPHLWTC